MSGQQQRTQLDKGSLENGRNRAAATSLLHRRSV